MSNLKSVITCDLEGLIQTMNKDAEEVFGYPKEELIGTKRVSLFSPGEVVLQNVEFWLAEAVKNGEYSTKTNFIKKDGTTFGAKIKVTPTYKGKQHIGYCGITEPIDETVDVKINVFTKILKWLVIARAPFLSAALIPCGVGVAFASQRGLEINSLAVVLAFLGVAFLHMFSNVFNDYYDWKNGVDQANTGYFTKFSGGSRSIELGLIDHENTFKTGVVLGLISLAFGIGVIYLTNITTLYIALVGVALGFFYTAPPFNLISKRGLGELTIFLAFGPFITLGMYYVATMNLSLDAFLIGFPAGLLTTNILLINEVPDTPSDRETGKNHLLVTFGVESAPYFYFVFNTLAFLSSVYLIYTYNLPYVWIAAATILLWGTKLTMNLKKYLNDRILVNTNINTIILNTVAGILFIVGILV